MIWWFALGYFACYVPYAALTRGLTAGLIGEHGADGPLPGLSVLPAAATASALGMLAFITAMGWWRYVGKTRVLGVTLPVPGPYTFLSGLCTAAILLTTTLAYTFHGVSVVLMMVLMRSGVLLLAPIVDLLTGRAVRPRSWVALGLSGGALAVSFESRGALSLSGPAVADLVVYLVAYFVRLRFMSRLAKSPDPDASRRYFVEEQIVATPASLVALAVLALVNGGAVSDSVAAGFDLLAGDPTLPILIAIGLLSQGTGVFGGLILLDARETSFCVPVNRASSLVAGVGAAYALHLVWGEAPPARGELLAVGLCVVAMVILSLPTRRTPEAPAR